MKEKRLMPSHPDHAEMSLLAYLISVIKNPQYFFWGKINTGVEEVQRVDMDQATWRATISKMEDVQQEMIDDPLMGSEMSRFVHNMGIDRRLPKERKKK
jgi:hypothetical protein